MTLSENLNVGGWTGFTEYRDRRIDLDIDADLWEVDPKEAVHSALDSLDLRWLEIEKALVEASLKLYNENWADPSHGFPRLRPQQFIERLSLTSVSIGQGSITIYFADGNLFAGHTVSVIIVGNQKPTTMIEG